MNPHKQTLFKAANNPMKRSPSELVLEALVNNKSMATIKDHHHDHHHDYHIPLFDTNYNYYHHHNHQQHDVADFFDPTAGVASADEHLTFDFKTQDTINSFGSGGTFDQQTVSWHQNLTPQQSCPSATIDSQSSICAGSPTSTLVYKPKVGDNQGSYSSEDDEGELEAGQCEQSDDPLQVKRLRRMVSNRESARRSRKRRQAQQQELEMQVDQLNVENSSLFKQLNEAAQQLREATTNNRVLKSDVEAMRAKVKLLEDRVTRGTLNHILQTTLSSPSPQLAASAQNLSRMVNAIAPTMMVQGQETSFDGAFPWPNSSIENENNIANLHDSNATSGSIASNNTISGVSCVTGLWP
ncbi:bZIP transcription factor RISBZ4 isoform X2 [Amaranthus tricolor]|uniref:bZIP transcription factor RISBZ4 isoform X2 n=1 Tax=Amaranthus tricolor TaxID=29722 RepID=UPI0025890138|nr:bZIP transcription factor RISBZ4 isoform X2 [Amaranthus tricolor]